MDEILNQLKDVIEQVVNMKVNEDTDVLLSELEDIHTKLSALNNTAHRRRMVELPPRNVRAVGGCPTENETA